MTQQIDFPSHAITLAAAQRVIDAGVKASEALGVSMSIVVVDAAGHITAVGRMDGASMLTYDVAFKKAWTSAMTGAPTAGVHQFVTSDPGATLSMPHVQHFSTVAGGLPIARQNACIGAVGVSGATAEVDLKVAEAAVAALMD